MSEVTRHKGVQSAIHQVELREGEVVQIRVHLVTRPCQIQEVEQCVQPYDQIRNVSFWKSVNQHIDNPIEEVVRAASSTAVASLREPVE